MIFGVVVVFCFLHDEVKGDAKGIRLCERECRLLQGCTAIRYDPMHLNCTKLKNKQSVPRDARKDVAFITQDMSAKEHLKSCHANDVILFNRWEKPVCVLTGHTQGPEDLKYRRMIIVPKHSNMKVGLRLDLVTLDFAMFVSSVKHISAVAHLRSKHLLLIAIRNTVFVSNPRLRQAKVFKRGLDVSRIRVDDGRKFVFFLETKKRNPNLILMPYSKNGEIRFPVSAFNMEIDSKFKTVYALGGDRLFLFSYEGRVINTIGMDMKGAAALSCKPGRLYYSLNKGMLLKTITKSGQVSTVGSFRLPDLPLCNIIDMKVFSRYVYITCFERTNFIIRMDLTDPKNVISKSLMRPILKYGFLFAREM